jgi:beta-xylosidase
MRRSIGRALAVILAALLMAGCATGGLAAPEGPAPVALAPAADASAIRNPVFDHDFPDPDLLRVGDGWYAYATNANGMNIQAAMSPDLKTWRLVGNALPRAPRWADKAFGYHWAPEVSRFGGHYVMYFTARLPVGSGGMQCIGVASSDAPHGPFLPDEPSNAAPFVCQRDEGGSIDPAVFVDDDGTAYLLWKSDANSRGGRAWLYLQRLSADGRQLEGQPARLIAADARWEGMLVEAPTLRKRDGRYYLFYSANDYRSRDYAVGYAVADRAEGPYTKAAENPILKTDLATGIVGPGGQDVVDGPDGQTYIIFHSWTAGAYRGLDLAPLAWEDGKPVVKLPPRAPRP